MDQLKVASNTLCNWCQRQFPGVGSIAHKERWGLSTRSEGRQLQFLLQLHLHEAMDSRRLVRLTIIPLVILLSIFSCGVLVDSVSVNLINDLGEPFTYICEVGSSTDASRGPLDGTLKNSEKITVYAGVDGSRSCNFWFEDSDTGDLNQLEFHVCHYHADEPDDIYEWTIRKTGIYLSESEFKHQWRTTRYYPKCIWSST